MALIACPECGRENVSDSASACPNCGFNLLEYKQKAERTRKLEEDAFRRAKALNEAREKHQAELDSIKMPASYGNPLVYLLIGVSWLILSIFFIILGVSGVAVLFFFVALIIGGLYFLVQHGEYKRAYSDETAYREEQLSKLKNEVTNSPTRIVANTTSQESELICPHCGGTKITTQLFQENDTVKTVSTTKGSIKEKRHGCLYWLLFIWLIDLLLWIFAFVPRLILQLIRKKKYKVSTTTVSDTTNNYQYRTIHTCQTCGHIWS